MTKDKNSNNSFPHLSDLLWDFWCLSSIVGIWPRYIEPNLLSVTTKPISIKNLPKALEGFKILQFSDLHLQAKTPKRYLEKIIETTARLSPDLILFTGDFICHSVLAEEDRLLNFLNRLQAPYGCFAVLGNHDYDSPISVNSEGDYDIVPDEGSNISRGFSRLFNHVTLSKRTTDRAMAVKPHADLLALLKKTPFTLLHNESQCLQIKDSALNICGLGEYSVGKATVEEGFRNYDSEYPGIIMLRNPDGLPLLKKCPGDIVLSGHTHGGQVNLPWMWKKFTLMENPELKRGLKFAYGKWIYINRGVGSVMPFRWFAKPELLLLTLEGAL